MDGGVHKHRKSIWKQKLSWGWKPNFILDPGCKNGYLLADSDDTAGKPGSRIARCFAQLVTTFTQIIYISMDLKKGKEYKMKWIQLLREEQLTGKFSLTATAFVHILFLHINTFLLQYNLLVSYWITQL